MNHLRDERNPLFYNYYCIAYLVKLHTLWSVDFSAFLASYYDIDAIEALFEALEQLVSPNWRYAQIDSNRCNSLCTKT